MSSDLIDVVQLTNTILDIVQQAANYKQLRKGANEGESCEAATAQLLVSNKLGYITSVIVACSNQNTEPWHIRVRSDGC